MGYAPAINTAGYFYENGIDEVPQDTKKALDLFKSICDKLPHAAYNYARLSALKNNSAKKDEIKNTI